MAEIPRVSVLVSVLNGQDYLREAVDSVLAQTMADFELILVDNASTDGTAAIIASYDDPRMVVIRNDHVVPLPVSLNRGLAQARAPLVARLDADDIATPQRLERQVAVMDAHADLALLGTWWDDFWDEKNGRRVEACPPTPTESAALIDALAAGNPIAHPSVMLRRDAVLAAGGYPEDFAYAQDYALWLRLARAHTLAVLPERLTLIRNHAAQLSTSPAWAGTRLEDVIRLHTEALALPLSRRGRTAGQWALASACYRLAMVRLRHRTPVAALALAARGFATAPLATLRRAAGQPAVAP